MNQPISLLLITAICLSCSSSQQETNGIEYADLPEKEFDYSTFVGKDYLVDNQHSYLGFTIRYFGYSPVRGRFNEFEGTVFYDSTNISATSVSIVIDVASLNTGNDRRDGDLRSTGTWFNAPEFPLITFESHSILPLVNGGFDVVGEMKIKGVSKTDTIRFDPPTKISRDWASNEQVDFTGKFTIDRQEFGVFGGDFWSQIMEDGLTQLSDEVDIELNIHCRRADYLRRYDDSTDDDISKQILDAIENEGIGLGLSMIDSLLATDQISSGKLSTIGYTLNARDRFEDAEKIFKKRLEAFPEKMTSLNQLGITYLLAGNRKMGSEMFRKMNESDSTDTRSKEYLRLINRLNN